MELSLRLLFPPKLADRLMIGYGALSVAGVLTMALADLELAALLFGALFGLSDSMAATSGLRALINRDSPRCVRQAAFGFVLHQFGVIYELALETYGGIINKEMEALGLGWAFLFGVLPLQLLCMRGIFKSPPSRAYPQDTLRENYVDYVAIGAPFLFLVAAIFSPRKIVPWYYAHNEVVVWIMLAVVPVSLMISPFIILYFHFNLDRQTDRVAIIDSTPAVPTLAKVIGPNGNDNGLDEESLTDI